MKRALLTATVLAASAFMARPCVAQDPLSQHKVRGLKNLHSIAIVLRSNTPKEIASPKEWSDFLAVGLHQMVPDLIIAPSADSASDWMELNIVTTDAGAFLELSVYRWVRLLATGDRVFTKVWWDQRVILGATDRTLLHDPLDALLTSFAADYLRAK